ncbi:MAG: glucose 1-dehydrogenase [Chloroflexi bacterium]|nr:glucose 1-dehydrogenase [Chloroflexota bacterium]
MDLSRFSLQGKVALITGGSRGIGEATALAFAQAGADVAVTARKVPELEAAADKIKNLGRKSLAIPANVRYMNELQDIVDAVVEEFGTIDILVNNAGMGLKMPAIEVDEKAWDAVIDLNLKSVFFLSQAAARVMRVHGGGKIINVASADAFKPDYHLASYSISKAAVVMLTKSLAIEWAEYNIRVNAVAPGAIRTRILESKFAAVPGAEEEAMRRPLGIGEPDDIAGIMVYLASDASRYATGQTFIVDGGELLR